MVNVIKITLIMTQYLKLISCCARKLVELEFSVYACKCAGKYFISKSFSNSYSVVT